MNKNVWKKQSSVLRALSRHAIRQGKALPIDWPAKQIYNLTMSIFKQVHKAVDGELARVREAEYLLGLSKHYEVETSPEMYNNPAMAKYNRVYSNGKIDRTYLAAENSPDFALVRHAAKLAEDIQSEKVEAVLS